VFGGSTSFKDVDIFGGVSFSQTKFEQVTDFTNLTVTNAPFNPELDTVPGSPLGRTLYPPSQFAILRTQFESSVNLSVKVEGTASIEDFTYSGVASNVSIFASDKVLLNRVSLESFNVLILSSDTLVAVSRVQMHGGGELKIAAPQLELTNFTCARPVTASHSADQLPDAPTTKLTTLAGTNCDGLTLEDFDYRDTRFLGATNLELLIVGGEFTLLSTGRQYARRYVLWEETLTRSTNYWHNLAGLSHSEDYPPPDQRRLAAVYRLFRLSGGLV